MSVGKNPHRPLPGSSPGRSSLSRGRERVGGRAFPLRKYAKRAGLVVLALVALDFAAGAAAMMLGIEYLKR